MKTIKIRFVDYKNTSGNLSIQRKTFFGWKDVGYIIDMGYGSVYNLYYHPSKEELLKEVLEKYYKRDKKFTNVIEYPTILKY